MSSGNELTFSRALDVRWAQRGGRESQGGAGRGSPASVAWVLPTNPLPIHP